MPGIGDAVASTLIGDLPERPLSDRCRSFVVATSRRGTLSPLTHQGSSRTLKSLRG
jgi:hypothetical protein